MAYNNIDISYTYTQRERSLILDIKKVYKQVRVREKKGES